MKLCPGLWYQTRGKASYFHLQSLLLVASYIEWPFSLVWGRLDSSPNPVPPPENYCFVMLCIPKPVPHAGQGLDDVAVA